LYIKINVQTLLSTFIMEEIDFNDIVVKTVLENISTSEKPVTRLVEILEISRESAYRRIRQDIPFTFEEIAKLALTLNFSIDNIIEGSKKETFSFDLQSKIISPTANTYIAQFHEYNYYLKNLINATQSETFMALNEIPPLFFILSEQLFKFNYFQWLHTHSEKSVSCSFSELIMTTELLSIRKEIFANISKVSNVTIILSPYIYISMLKSIQYFYYRKLLSQDELLLIKKDVLDFINLAETFAKNGYFTPDSKVDFYLSTLNVNSNILFLKYDETSEIHFWIYPSNPLIVRDPEICAIQKDWFQSLKKQSMLITLSNEILQANYYVKQRENVEKYLTEEVNFTYGY
jgi:hypothetical protein